MKRKADYEVMYKTVGSRAVQLILSPWIARRRRMMTTVMVATAFSFIYLSLFMVSVNVEEGGLVSSLGSVIHTSGLHLKGPVYISLFNPLSMVIAVAMGAIFLGDALYLGSVVGSVILSLGFYTVIWGRSRENSIRTVAGSEQSPLLLTHTIGDEASSL